MPQPEDGACAPPSCMIHRRSVTEALGGWRDYREIERVSPEIELWRRAQRCRISIHVRAAADGDQVSRFDAARRLP